MVVQTITGALKGIECNLIHVEVDVSSGLPCMELVGSLGSEVKEAKERVKVALQNSGISLPPMRITINLSPADIRKEGTGYDLPIAIALLIATGNLQEDIFEDVFIAGELGLNGEIKPVKGILPMLLEAKKRGIRKCLIPKKNISEASIVEGLQIISYEFLYELIEKISETGKTFEISGGNRWIIKADMDEKADGVKIKNEDENIENNKDNNKDNNKENNKIVSDEGSNLNILLMKMKSKKRMPDFADVYGQENIKRAMEIAAAGFHNLLMIGPPGSGKSMSAKCIPSILPDMSMEEMLEVSKIYSVAGLLSEEEYLIQNRPFISPHHTITYSAFAGSGRNPQPGMISRAHKGVLFLDEIAHFSSQTLESLRQPLEDKEIHICRSGGNYVFPADIMLVAAMNPCPCGYYPDLNKCNCTREQISKYLGKISGPILDRIDMCVESSKIEWNMLKNDNAMKTNDSQKCNYSSEYIRRQVEKARIMQEKRYKGTRIRFNSELSSSEINNYIEFAEDVSPLLEKIYKKYELSARAYHRMIKVARTIADLEEAKLVQRNHVLEAVGYRGIEHKYWRE